MICVFIKGLPVALKFTESHLFADEIKVLSMKYNVHNKMYESKRYLVFGISRNKNNVRISISRLPGSC